MSFEEARVAVLSALSKSNSHCNRLEVVDDMKSSSVLLTDCRCPHTCAVPCHLSVSEQYEGDLAHLQMQLPKLCEELARSHVDNVKGFERDIAR